MEEPESPSSPNTTAPPTCEECRQNPWKYRCPGCSILTCSLPCVKSHKYRTGCTGQRNRTQFVPLSQFDDNLLLSDYNLLEETKRATDSARRMRGFFGTQIGWRPRRFGGHSGLKLPFKLRLLRNAAFRRKARLLLLPAGMSKREKNQSRYYQRSRSIFWTIEWHFHSTNVILTDHSVDERMNLISIMEKHLKPTPWNHQLRPFCNEEINNLKFFFQKNPKDFKSPFRELDVRIPIGEQMANITIVEYPVIFVFLPTQSYDFEVEVDKMSLHKAVKKVESPDNQLSPKGVLFREEEPEENDALCDTRVLDLTDYMKSEPYNKFQTGKGSSLLDKTPAFSNVEMPRHSAEGSMPLSGVKDQTCGGEAANDCSNCSSNSHVTSFNTDFDFEQDLMDAYSDLVGEINPDDFLCLDAEYGEGCQVEESKVVGFCGEKVPEDDELEEGEIPNY